MKFERMPVDEAEDCLLAHTLHVDGKRWSKGRRLDAGDLQRIRAEGIEWITAARMAPDDIHEDAAAGAIAEALCGEGVECGKAFTGRCNLYARSDGVAVLDAQRLDAFNAIDEALTVATVPPLERVREGQMLATIKVIPFAVPATLLNDAVAGITEPAVTVAAFRPRRFSLVLTALPGTRDEIVAKGERGVRERLAVLGSTLATSVSCAHETDAIRDALRAQMAEGPDAVLVFAASAITDRRDVIPAALEAAGGTIERFGMPVDPGNLLLLGRHGTTPVIGLPGCARSPKINGLDWVLRRLCAGLPLTSRTLAAMGVGGLLQETSERPQARERRPAQAQRKPQIPAVILAAGHSRRMGTGNKLLAQWQGMPLLQHAVDSARESGARPVYVVTGHEGDRVAASLKDQPVVVIHNPDYAQGLASSLRAAVRALPDTADGLLVCLGDMPLVRPAHLDALLGAFSPTEGRAICVPTYQGKRGNPVLLGAEFFPQLTEVRGDRGARGLISAHADRVAEVPVDDAGVLMDVDTPAALDELLAGATGEHAQDAD